MKYVIVIVVVDDVTIFRMQNDFYFVLLKCNIEKYY